MSICVVCVGVLLAVLVVAMPCDVFRLDLFDVCGVVLL